MLAEATKPLRVLYAVQSTGNGHLSRCMEFYPILIKYAQVDVLLSGIQGDLKLPFEVKFKKHGLGFIFGKRGGINYLKTLFTLRPFTLIKDIISLDLSKYDLVINDFEPISAWACFFKRKNCISLSHQASFKSKKTPRPKKKNRFAEFIFKYFAPSKSYAGLHYQAYDKNIYTPIVRNEIRLLPRNYNKKEVIVYLPAFSQDLLIEKFQSFRDYKWSIFSKHTDEPKNYGNIDVFPVGTAKWNEIMSISSFAIIGGGFEGPSEMLFMEKKLMVIPMTDQYEQLCNAEALKVMGVCINYLIDDGFEERIGAWLKDCKVIEINFPRRSEEIIRNVLNIQSN